MTYLLSPFPPRRRWALLLLVAAALCAPLSASGASAGPDAIVAPPPRLPAPTGVAPIGARTLALVDRSRRDPFAPRKDGGRKRAVVVSLWYPARPSHAPLAHYAPRRVLPALVEDSGVSPAAAGLRTHARTGAPMAPGIHPLLLFSPGTPSRVSATSNWQRNWPATATSSRPSTTPTNPPPSCCPAAASSRAG